MDCNLPGSSVHGILQARILEWVAISSSQEIFPTQESKLHLLQVSCVAGGFFTAEPPGKPNIHTLLYIKQITKESLLYGTGNYIQHLIIIYNRKLNHFAIHLNLHNILNQVYFNKKKKITWLSSLR